MRRPLVLVMVSSMIAGVGVVAATAAPAAPPAAPAAAERGAITWHPCTTDDSLAGFQCGTLTVPIDWDDLSNPGNASIELAVHKATSPKRIGALTFNPGGPGESGMALATAILGQLPPQVRSRFDFVAWDPRGIGLSEPQLDNCLGPRAEPYELPATGPVDWEAYAQTYYDTYAQVLPACLEVNPDVAPYLGTYYVIRDLEAMRMALGQKQWNFWGMSYGTRIGYRYARQFPTSLRTLILDGSWDPNLTVTSWMNAESWNFATGQAVFSSLFGKKMAYRLQRVIDGLNETTITVGGQEQTRWTILSAIFTNISYQSAFPDVLDVIRLADEALRTKDQGAADRMRKPLQRLQERANVNPNASLNINYINCRDIGDYPSVEEMARAAKVSAANNSVFAGLNAIAKGAMCAGLPQDFTHGYSPLTHNLTLPTSPVVINSLGDTRTEYVFGRTMANYLTGASLITYDSTQHVSYAQTPSRCINSAATTYLLTQRLPGDLLCPYAPLSAG